MEGRRRGGAEASGGVNGPFTARLARASCPCPHLGIVPGQTPSFPSNCLFRVGVILRLPVRRILHACVGLTRESTGVDQVGECRAGRNAALRRKFLLTCGNQEFWSGDVTG